MRDALTLKIVKPRLGRAPTYGQAVSVALVYHRYDTAAELALLNGIWEFDRTFTNYLLPQQKLVFKQRNGAKGTKRYDTATTPHQRGIAFEAVWDAVLAGDSRTFGVLYDRHRDRVFRHALRQFSEPVEAEDLTAIAFLELWRRRASARFVDE